MDEQINLMEYIKVIMKWKNFIISFTAILVIITSLACLVMPRSYKAETVILIPRQSSHGLESVAALSSMMSGVAVNMPADLSQSLIGRTTNFIDILKSRTIAEMIVKGLDLDRNSGGAKKNALVKRIMKNIKVKERKGLMLLSYSDRNPRLAADIVNYSALALDEFNKKGNIQFAKRLNLFIREQMAAAKIDLDEAEEKLKKFETQSQMVKLGEKEILLARHLRDVKVREAIYTMLLQEYEKTKIEGAKEELFFEVLDPAYPPKTPSSPKPMLYLMISLVLGVTTGMMLAFFFEYLVSIGIKVPEIQYEREVKWKDLKISSIMKKK